MKFPNYRTDVTVDWPDEKQKACMVFVRAYGITPWVREGAKLAGLSAQGGQVRYTLTASGKGPLVRADRNQNDGYYFALQEFDS